MTTTTAAHTGICCGCGAKLTHLLTVQSIDGDEPNAAPFSCPACGLAGTLPSLPGRRIVKVETKKYLDPLGR